MVMYYNRNVPTNGHVGACRTTALNVYKAPCPQFGHTIRTVPTWAIGIGFASMCACNVRGCRMFIKIVLILKVFDDGMAGGRGGGEERGRGQ